MYNVLNIVFLNQKVETDYKTDAISTVTNAFPNMDVSGRLFIFI